MKEDGGINVTLPRFASQKHAQDIIDSSRNDIRKWQKTVQKQNVIFSDGDTIGQSHVIRFTSNSNSKQVTVGIDGLTIHVKHPVHLFPHADSVQNAARPYIKKALQKEARAYLPRRLQYLAEQYGFHYETVRFGTQKGRWGSCSSRGTISLNVGLMLLEPELIDYVLIHELCHTRQMNHSPKFWNLVEHYLPNYKELKKRIRTKKPNV
jgi:predicted metal-dependent hydrolase